MLTFLCIVLAVLAVGGSPVHDVNERRHDTDNMVESVYNVDVGSGEVFPAANTPSPINCTDPRTSCSARGVCHPDATRCICDHGYTTIPKDGDVHCNYRQKDQFNAFYLLPWDFLFAFTHFYIGHVTAGIVKLCFIWIGIILAVFGTVVEVDCISLIGVIFAIIGLLWTVVVAFQIHSGTIQDGDGVSLANW